MIISYRQYDMTIRWAVQKKLDKLGYAPAECTVADNCNVILEGRPVEKQLVVVDDWKQKIYNYVNKGENL